MNNTLEIKQPGNYSLVEDLHQNIIFGCSGINLDGGFHIIKGWVHIGHSDTVLTNVTVNPTSLPPINHDGKCEICNGYIGTEETGLVLFHLPGNEYIGNVICDGVTLIPPENIALDYVLY